jgi:hypothetical protein
MFMQIALLVLFIWIVLSGGTRFNSNGNGNGSTETFVILFLLVAWVAWKIFNYL